MALSSLFEECQDLIERGHESWESYFTKWEVLAKYEEDVPESYFCKKSGPTIIHDGKKKKKNIPKIKKRKLQSLISYKKNQKKVFKKKKPFLKSVEAHKSLVHCTNSCKELDDKTNQNEVMETNLKTFFRKFLRQNQNKFEIFGVLSLAFSSGKSNTCKLFQQELHCYDFQLNKTAVSNQHPEMIMSNKLVSPVRNTDYFRGTINSEYHSKSLTKVRTLRWSNNHALNDRYSRFELFKSTPNINQTSRIITKINLSDKNKYLPLLSSPSYRNSKLKPLDWDLSHISSVREINNMRTFPKINITQDRERFRNICLDKRTNSVSLEKSNFTTPERKPPERKCFSENVSQRKRRCPSKLFFDNEEDSESDDQTENQTPLIQCKIKKLKTQKMTEVVPSDFEDYESIFDRVRK